jgi:hypothetical protein
MFSILPAVGLVTGPETHDGVGALLDFEAVIKQNKAYRPRRTRAAWQGVPFIH